MQCHQARPVSRVGWIAPQNVQVEMNNTTFDANEQLLQLELLVQEKDQLLGIVTERLEQAVEQLDRFRREGVQPTFEEPTHSDSLAVDEPDLKNSLRQMLDDWRDLQDRGWFNHLDQRLDTIQSWVSQAELPSGTRSRPEMPTEAASKAKPQKDESEDYSSSVAEILARYSKSEKSNSETTEKAAPAAPVPELPFTTSVNPSDFESAADSMLVPLPLAPDPIDLDAADVNELRVAVVARDAYIEQLQEYLHTMDGTNQEAVHFPALDSLTSQQQEILDQWSESIRKEFRQTQIQISLERAQLSRETMKLQNQQQMVERELRRLDIAKQMDAVSPDTESGETSRSRSWLGLFGTK